MQYKIQYTDSTDRQTKIDSNKDKILIEEQNYLNEENYLIFSDIKPLENQVKELQDNQLTLMNAIADLYAALPTSTT